MSFIQLQMLDCCYRSAKGEKKITLIVAERGSVKIVRCPILTHKRWRSIAFQQAKNDWIFHHFQSTVVKVLPSDIMSIVVWVTAARCRVFCVGHWLGLLNLDINTVCPKLTQTFPFGWLLQEESSNPGRQVVFQETFCAITHLFVEGSLLDFWAVPVFAIAITAIENTVPIEKHCLSWTLVTSYACWHCKTHNTKL